MLLEAVWDYNFHPQTNVVDVHISKLRQGVAGEARHAEAALVERRRELQETQPLGRTEDPDAGP